MIALYIIGNTICGFAQSMEVLVAGRVISGLGAGGLQALSQITIGDIFTPQERGRWIGVIMSVFGAATRPPPEMTKLLATALKHQQKATRTRKKRIFVVMLSIIHDFKPQN